MKKKRFLNDAVLIGLLILIPITMLIFSSISKNSTFDKTLLITVDGKTYEKLPLSDDTKITVASKTGFNYVIIENGKVWVSDADCPNKTCVNHRAISIPGEQIVCLPHKMVLEILGKDDKDIDSLSQ